MNSNWTIRVVTLLTLVAAPALMRAAPMAKDLAQEQIKEGAEATKDAVVKGAKVTGKKTKEALSKTGEVMTDGWITSRVSARFVTEDLLKDSKWDPLESTCRHASLSIL